MIEVVKNDSFVVWFSFPKKIKSLAFMCLRLAFCCTFFLLFHLSVHGLEKKGVGDRGGKKEWREGSKTKTRNENQEVEEKQARTRKREKGKPRPTPSSHALVKNR